MSATLPSTVVSMPASASTRGSRGQLGLEVAGAQAADGRADLGERLACGLLDGLELASRAVGVDVDETRGELGLDAEGGEGVTEHVVDVAGDPLALGDEGVLPLRPEDDLLAARRRSGASRRPA